MKTCKGLAGLALGAAAAAGAQSPVTAQVPGTVDPVKATAAQQADRAGYNSTIAQLSPRGVKGAPVPAAAADVVAGRPLRDIKGEPIARVDAVDAQGVIVATGSTRVRLPLNAFGKDDLGLLLGITADRFRALVVKATNSGG
jgi:lipoprotein-anchoring transpeptidase ErfK/SrfK